MTRIKPDRALSYADAVRWIYERIDYERIPPVRASPHFQLERVRRLLDLIGAPQQRIRAVHIAGTKGKGSTAAMLASVLQSSAIRSGLFISPHLVVFEERMTVDGQRPDREDLISLVEELQQRLEAAPKDLKDAPPTYFEVATLLAWMYFDRQQVDLVVLETGLGGRLDCTNVCNPVVTVITNIGLDHTAILGDTLEKIASEKAGIIKQGVPVITGVTQPEVIRLCEGKAKSCGAAMIRLHQDIQVEVATSSRQMQIINVTTPHRQHDGLPLPLIGTHQAENASLAVAVADLLSETDSRITSATIREGLNRTSWPLRFEVVPGSPTVILDAAHNPDAVRAVIQTLNNGSWPERPRVLIFGASREKDVKSMLGLLLPEFDHVVLTTFQNNPRSFSPEDLEKIVSSFNPSATIAVAETTAEALDIARRTATVDGLVFATGSVFLAAECRGHLPF
jgi:dihydrofolate synthase/folylpolyglutamate synthase